MMVTRYDLYLDYPHNYAEPEVGMEPCEDGGFVKYEDYEKTVEQLTVAAKAAWEDGYDLGFDEAAERFHG